MGRVHSMAESESRRYGLSPGNRGSRYPSIEVIEGVSQNGCYHVQFPSTVEVTIVAVVVIIIIPMV